MGASKLTFSVDSGYGKAMDFRALDAALLQAEASELAARQEWAAAHWEVMHLVGGLRGGLVEY
jgi:UDP:flavonoid glycosyltransferase YjiC (YdhE family)